MSEQVNRFFMMIITAGVGSLFVYGLTRIPENWQNPTETSFLGFLIFTLFSAMFVIGFLILLRNFIYAFGHELTVYEGGIKHQYMGKTESWTWDELEALSYYNLKVEQQAGLSTHEYMLRLRSKDNKTIYLDQIYADFEKLGYLLLKLTGDAWMRRDFMRLKNGETLTYGNLSVHQEGIKQGKKFIPWNNIERIDKLPTSFSIVPFGERRRLFHIGSTGIHGVPLKVWNAHVLLELIKSMAQL